jgi:hypothetical protein
MYRIRQISAIAIAAIISTTASLPAQAGLTIRIGNPGYGYNYGYNIGSYQYYPGIRTYSGPITYSRGYSSPRHRPYKQYKKHNKYRAKKHIPSTSIYGYYPFATQYNYGYQPRSSYFNSFRNNHKRGYDQGYQDGYNASHRRQGGRLGIKVK